MYGDSVHSVEYQVIDGERWKKEDENTHIGAGTGTSGTAASVYMLMAAVEQTSASAEDECKSASLWHPEEEDA